MSYDIEYLGGHPKVANPSKAVINIDKESKVIEIKHRGFSVPFTPIFIMRGDIKGVSYERAGSRSVGKTAAGAIVGGVLTGGVGLLIGGALGARKKDKSQLFLTIDYLGREFTVILKTGKYTDNIYAEINGLFG